MGMVAMLIAGLILFPLVFLIFDTFFELYVFSESPPDAWINNLTIGITIILWFLISSMAGGVTCTIIAQRKEDFTVFLLIVITFTISYLISQGEILNGKLWETVAVFISFITGYITGGFIGVRYKLKKSKNVFHGTTNNFSSQPDSPTQ